MLRNLQLRNGVTCFLFLFLVQAGIFFVVPLFLSVALGMSAVATGVRLLPLSLTLLAFAVGVPKLRPNASPQRVIRIGFLALFGGLVLLLVLLDYGAGAEIVTWPLLLAGAGIGSIASQLGSVTVSAVPDEQSGEVGGLQNTGTQLGASIGTALAGAVLISALTASLVTGIENNPKVPDRVVNQGADEPLERRPVHLRRRPRGRAEGCARPAADGERDRGRERDGPNRRAPLGRGAPGADRTPRPAVHPGHPDGAARRCGRGGPSADTGIDPDSGRASRSRSVSGTQRLGKARGWAGRTVRVVLRRVTAGAAVPSLNHVVVGNRWGTGRIEAFSDGVFAIAITLLILEVGVPEASFDNLWRGIVDQWPSYLAYATSFLTIGGIWVAHHAIFRRLQFANQRVMVINLVLLMAVSFLPFPTKLMAEAIHDTSAERAAVIFYGGSLLVISLLIGALWASIARDRDLLRPEVTEKEVNAILIATTPNHGFYIGVIVLAIFAPRVAAFGYLLIAIVALLRMRGDQTPPPTTAPA